MEQGKTRLIAKKKKHLRNSISLRDSYILILLLLLSEKNRVVVYILMLKFRQPNANTYQDTRGSVCSHYFEYYSVAAYL